MKSFWSAGTSSSAKIASTGHSATQRVQSMHSSGSMTSMFGPSRKQSTGHTSTQSVYLHFTQDSVTTYVMEAFRKSGNAGEKTAILAERHRRSVAPAQSPQIGLRYRRGVPRPTPLEPSRPAPISLKEVKVSEKIVHITDDTFEQEV